MNEQTSKFRLPVDTNKDCKLSNKMSFVCLSAYRALSPNGDWTRPETDCLQHSKETVLYICVTHLNGGRGGVGGIKRDRETERKRKYNMHKILPDEH